MRSFGPLVGLSDLGPSPLYSGERGWGEGSGDLHAEGSRGACPTLTPDSSPLEYKVRGETQRAILVELS
jgi:hypothetical protein